MDKPTSIPQEAVREFVISGHGNLARVREMLDETPELLNVKYQWADNDWESAIQAAAHVGSAPVAEYLISKGAPLEICTAAMLGRRGEIDSMLASDTALIYQNGAHGIPLLAHAAFNGDMALFSYLMTRGAEAGLSYALHNAVTSNHAGLAKWILENTEPYLSWKNYEGKTALAVAMEQGNQELQDLLRSRGALA
jgi:ankyrin repeat protein